MVYRRVITERYIMVRIGPEPVTFWARNIKNRELLKAQKTDIVVPSIYSGLRGTDISISNKRVETLKGGVLWV